MDQETQKEPEKFKKINPRSQVKRMRLTVDENRQLDDFLEKRNLQFSDFNNSLIRETIRAGFHLVAMPDNYVRPAFPLKEKTVYRQPPRVDPPLLLELGRIGTNLNQCARALNIIKNDKGSELELSEKFSFLQCLQVLQLIQQDIHEVIGKLPKYSMSESAKAKARARAIAKVAGVKKNEAS